MRSLIAGVLSLFVIQLSACTGSVIDPPGENPVCGNGKVEPGEACDDGNTVDTDACTSACKAATCGDGLVHAGVEACDDGNTVDTDACTSACTEARCGDGFVQAGVEACDDGNTVDTDTCTSACKEARCGDGFTQPGEACDDGNSFNTDGCRNDCAVPSCGDGHVQPGEACDDGNTVDTDSCLSTCVAATCGDGNVQAGVEGCDDGNTVNTDTCTNACKAAACGDGFTQPGESCDDVSLVTCDADCSAVQCGDGLTNVAAGEACDDGNSVDTDACTNACAPALCGDGSVQAGVEQCDDGNTVNTDACTNGCTLARCGDGFTQPGEACDDGNTVNTDTCTNACKAAACGDGFTQPGEACDDGNTSNTDSCRNDCALPSCGDGFVQAGETCDDGNTVDTDSCLSTCVAASCGDGKIYAGVEQCDDANEDNNDDCLVGCFIAYCGDGYLKAGEACDDGNPLNTDACTNACNAAACGDGFVQANVEQCDTTGESAACDVDCSNAECGDGQTNVAAGEACDDQNTVNSDGCGACKLVTNTAPVAVSLPKAGATLETDEDTAVAITLEGSDAEDPVTFKVTAAPASGVLSGTAPNLTYTPGANFHGTDTFKYLVNDGAVNSAEATVSITVKSVNDAPVATATALETDEDTSLTFTLAGTDGDGDTLTFAVTAQPSHGQLTGTAPDLTYTPDTDYFGPDAFEFTVDDGSGPSAAARVDLTVKSVNDLPVLTARKALVRLGQTSGIKVEASDVETATANLAYTPTGAGPQKGTLGGTFPDLTYTPFQGAMGKDTFTVMVTDEDGGSSTATLTVYLHTPTSERLSAGGGHACAVMGNGSVKCWGRNWIDIDGVGSVMTGQLGTDTVGMWGDLPEETAQNAPPVDLGTHADGTPYRALSVSAGYVHSCAVLDDHTVKCWGWNEFGGLGVGDTVARITPTHVIQPVVGDSNKANWPPLQGVKAVSVGEFFTCALMQDDGVKCWGLDNRSLLGLGSTPSVLDPNLPQSYTDTPTDYVRNDFDLDGDNALDILRARRVMAGGWHACALTLNDEVTCWGHGGDGDVGRGNTDFATRPGPAVDVGTGRRVVDLEAHNAYHSCVLLDDATLKCWGWNSAGQLGTGDTVSRGNAPGQMGDDLQAVDLGQDRVALETSMGWEHTCARLDNGQVKCWGHNSAGQLGLGTNANVEVPTDAVDLGAQRTVVSLALGGYSSCALLDSDEVKCWGLNDVGQLGLGDLQQRGDEPNELGDTLLACIDLAPVPVGISRAQVVRPGVSTTFEIPIYAESSAELTYSLNTANLVGTLTESGRFLTFTPVAGQNGPFNLSITGTDAQGQSATANVELSVRDAVPVPTHLSVGYHHVCAVQSNGAVRCWGSDDNGKLGNGSSTTSHWGDEAGETPSNSPPVDLGPGRTAKAVAAGTHHTCALLDDDSVKCWGNNGNGMLGTGDTTGLDAPPANPVNLGTDGNGNPYTAKALSLGEEFTCAVLNDDTVKCWGNNRDRQFGMGKDTPVDSNDNPVPVLQPGKAMVLPNGNPVHARAVSAGEWSTCALLFSGDVYCWGAGYGPNGTKVDFGRGIKALDLPAHTTAHDCALLDDGSLKCWRQNNYGQLGIGDTSPRSPTVKADMGFNLPAVDVGPGRSAVQLALGALHTCALLDDQSVKCWGNNDGGQLGLGNSVTTFAPTGVVDLGTGRHARAITAGGNTVCALLEGDEVRCWGYNGYGQLGLSNNNDTGNEPNELGDVLPVIFDLTSPPVALSRDLYVRPGETTPFEVLITDADSPGLLYELTSVNITGTLGGTTPNFTYTPPSGATPGQFLGQVVVKGTDPQGQSASGTLTLYLTDVVEPPRNVAVGANHTCTVTSAGKVRCWGLNNYYQLGVNELELPRDENGNTQEVWGESTARVNNATVLETAFNAPEVDTETRFGSKAREVYAGAWQTCAILVNETNPLLRNGRVACWGVAVASPNGSRSTPALVNLGTNAQGNPHTATNLAIGDEFACAVLEDASIKCWGDNRFGQLGVGDQDNHFTPTVPVAFENGTPAGGDTLRARALMAGDWFACALLLNGDVACWGQDDGRQGMGTSRYNAVRPTGTLRLGTTLKALQIGAGGGFHGCAVLDNGQTKCWGNNGSGQLGIGNFDFHGRLPGQMGDALPAVDFGTGVRAVQVTAGASHSCALLTNNAVKCWGANWTDISFVGQRITGQLGIDNNAIPREVLAPADAATLGTGRTTLGVAARSQNTCALLDGDELKCFGMNNGGQLGLGDANYRGGTTGDMTNLPACFDLTPVP